jgi:hypothetical protein
MACDAPWDLGAVMVRLYRLSGEFMMSDLAKGGLRTILAARARVTFPVVEPNERRGTGARRDAE